MLAQTLLPQIVKAFDAWSRGGRQRTFRDELEATLDRDVLRILDRETGLLDQLPSKIQQELKGKKASPRRLSTSTLDLYAHEITALYVKTARPGDTFDLFLDCLRRDCPTEERLVAYLRTQRKS